MRWHANASMLSHIPIGYILNIKRQPACVVINLITVDNFAALFNCTPVHRRQTLCKAIHLSWLGPEQFICCLVHRGSTDDLLSLQLSGGVV